MRNIIRAHHLNEGRDAVVLFDEAAWDPSRSLYLHPLREAHAAGEAQHVHEHLGTDYRELTGHSHFFAPFDEVVDVVIEKAQEWHAARA